MSSLTFFFILSPILAILLLSINLLLSPHNPYQEKDSAFECGFHSFLGQNRTQFSISFFIFALLFLLFDLEILLVYPYIVSAYSNGIYGLIVMLVFFLVLTIGFVFELGKNALKIDSRQMYEFHIENWKKTITVYSSFSYSIKRARALAKKKKKLISRRRKINIKRLELISYNLEMDIIVLQYRCHCISCKKESKLNNSDITLIEKIYSPRFPSLNQGIPNIFTKIYWYFLSLKYKYFDK